MVAAPAGIGRRPDSTFSRLGLPVAIDVTRRWRKAKQIRACCDATALGPRRHPNAPLMRACH